MKKKTGELKNFFRTFFGGAVRWYDWLLLAALCAFCFFFCEMRDLYHTAGCSYGFLDGHFLDFYDYLAEKGIAEDGSIGLHASYLPTVYLIFAIWNLPMRIFRVVPFATAELGFAAIMWAKLLPCLLFIAGGYIVFLIAKELGMHDRKAKIAMYAYLSMPVALYGQFILGQYESMIVFCILMGVLAWCRKKTVAFVAWFALAVTFKYTALIFFIPLVLLREKNIWKIICCIVGVMVIFGVEYLAFSHSEAFGIYAFGLGSGGDNPTGYITNAAYFTGFDLGGNLKYPVYLTYLAFAFVCAYSYFKHTATPEEEKRYAMYILCLAAAALFCFSKWHPHWLMIAVPFWTLTAFLHRDTKIFVAVDLLFMVLFVMFCTCQFAEVCDECMLENGIFKFMLPDGKMTPAVTMSEYLGKLDMSAELSLITAIMAVYALFKHPKYMAEDPNTAADGALGWIRARYVIGLLVFIVPALLCVKGSISGPQAAYEENRRELFVDFSEEKAVSQQFTSVGEKLLKVKFPVSRGAAFTEGDLFVTVSDENGRVLYEKTLSVGSMREGSIQSVYPDIDTVPGEKYTVSFEARENGAEKSFCLLGTGLDSPYGSAERGGEETGWHLNMFVYQ